MTASAPPPAYYARSTGTGGPADWWTLLHPPYTAWHLSYVALGAALAPRLQAGRLAATVAAFALAMGVAAHALDELHGRPLGTGIPARGLVAAAVVGLAGAVALGFAVLGTGVWPYAVAGVVLVVGYNLELAGGLLHNTTGFALAWGSFPLLVGYWSQAGTLSGAAGVAAAGAFALSWAQRALSTPARALRRRVSSAEATLSYADGTVRRLDAAGLRAPYESALRALTWATVGFAAAALLARATG